MEGTHLDVTPQHVYPEGEMSESLDHEACALDKPTAPRALLGARTNHHRFLGEL